MTEAERVAAAKTMLAKVGSGRVDPAHFTGAARWWSNNGSSYSIAEFNAVLADLHRRTTSGIPVTPFAVAAAGERVAIEATSRAQLRDGRTYANRYHFLIRFEGDCIAEVREYSDTLHIADMFDLRPPGMSPIEAVERFIAAWNARDRGAIAAALHEDVVCWGVPLTPARGRDEAMRLLDGFLAAEAIDWRILAIAAAGRTVFTERLDRFRFGGADWTEVACAGVMELAEDGRILAWRDYFDLAALQAAMPAS